MGKCVHNFIFIIVHRFLSSPSSQKAPLKQALGDYLEEAIKRKGAVRSAKKFQKDLTRLFSNAVTALSSLSRAHKQRCHDRCKKTSID
jgi:hypothetical protein